MTKLLRTPMAGGVVTAGSRDKELPPLSIAARNLMEQADYADLSTTMNALHHRRAGYPFCSTVDFATDSTGHPIFLSISFGNSHEKHCWRSKMFVDGENERLGWFSECPSHLIRGRLQTTKRESTRRRRTKYLKANTAREKRARNWRICGVIIHF